MFESITPHSWYWLHDGRAKACLAQVGFRPSAPNDHFRYVLDVAGQDDFLLVLIADESFLLQLVEVVDVALRVDHAPVRIGSVGNNKVVRQGKHALTIPSAVSDVPLVGLGTLELAGGVS